MLKKIRQLLSRLTNPRNDWRFYQPGELQRVAPNGEWEYRPMTPEERQEDIYWQAIR